MADILVVEDDLVLAKSLLFNMESERHEVTWARNLSGARNVLEEKSFDLVVLDIGLPDGDGRELCRELRQNSQAPILFLTALAEQDDVIEGFLAGAHDYVTKPFSIRELLARLQALLRHRARVSEDPQTIEFAGLEICKRRHQVSYQSAVIPLNRTKTEILFYLAQNSQKVITRDLIIRQLNRHIEINGRTVDAHVSQLRRLLKENEIFHVRITSIYGAGYKLEKVI